MTEEQHKQMASDVSGDSTLNTGVEAALAPERMFIYEGTFSVLTFNAEKTAGELHAIVKKHGGYVEKETRTEIVFRVPAKNFQAAYDETAQVDKVTDKSLNAQEVTKQFLDLQTRLKANELLLAQLQELLKRGGTVAELLEVQREVGKTIEQIEMLKSELKFLSERVAYSTISVHFQSQAAQIDQAFKLPYDWLRELGVEHLVNMQADYYY